MAKKSTKQAIKSFFGLGYHVWVILILANVLLFYSFQFYTKAAPQEDEPQTIAKDITPTTEPTQKPTSTPIPKGPVIDVSFSLPGIGTNGANVKPLHPKRDLFVLLYSSKENSNDRSVKPAYTLTSFVTYDDNPQSPTYTKFVNPYIDLGEQFEKGNYQVVFKMDQTLSQLVKEKENDIGGKVYNLGGYAARKVILPSQTMIVGDIYDIPRGDNIMDIKDHDLLLACFGNKADTEACESKEAADLNDDGLINGTDYNLMLGSFRTLKAMGIPIPSLYIASPSAQVTTKPSVKPTAKVSPTAAATRSGSGGGAIIFFIILLIFLGIGGFFAYKKGIIQKFMNPSPKSQPSSPEAETETTETATEQNPGEETAAADLEAPQQDMPTVDTIDKEYYVKTSKVDKEKNGVWLTLTDDNGPIEGYYSKGTEVTEGFAKIKGKKKIEGEKVYIEIEEIIGE